MLESGLEVVAFWPNVLQKVVFISCFFCFPLLLFTFMAHMMLLWFSLKHGCGQRCAWSYTCWCYVIWDGYESLICSIKQPCPFHSIWDTRDGHGYISPGFSIWIWHGEHRTSAIRARWFVKGLHPILRAALEFQPFRSYRWFDKFGRWFSGSGSFTLFDSGVFLLATSSKTWKYNLL